MSAFEPSFDAIAHDTWRRLFSQLSPKREQQLHPYFGEGLEYLQIDADRIPKLEEVNQRLMRKTGYQGVYVQGHEDPQSFFPMLSERKFPIGNFIRDPGDLNYTPAPDVFHDLYGHLPFLANEAYADFSCEFGRVASKYRHRPELLRQFERLYWFTQEFGLIQTPRGKRIFGGGIASSFTECDYALSSRPVVLGFDLEVIRNREFRIDELQNTLFLIPDEAALFNCLKDFEKGVLS